jgi:DNA-binding IscR family transcriptional regulator
VALNRCLDPHEGCERSADCPVHAALARAQRTLIAALDSVTLHSLTAREKAAQV